MHTHTLAHTHTHTPSPPRLTHYHHHHLPAAAHSNLVPTQSCKVLVTGEQGVVLPTAVKLHFLTLEVLNK